MKILKNVKIVLAMAISFGIIVMSTQVFAANNTSENYAGITDLNANNTSNNTSNNTANNTTTNNTTNNSALNNVSVLTTNNTTKYNNTALPNTGIGDVMPATLLVIVFGISAVYAYKKVQDYKNI